MYKGGGTVQDGRGWCAAPGLTLAKLWCPDGTCAGSEVAALMAMVRKGALFGALWRWRRRGGCSGDLRNMKSPHCGSDLCLVSWSKQLLGLLDWGCLSRACGGIVFIGLKATWRRLVLRPSFLFPYSCTIRDDVPLTDTLTASLTEND